MKINTVSMQQVALIRRHLLVGAVGTLSSLALPGFAQTYPNKTIRWIVPYAAGGASDIVARVIAESLSNALGQHVIVDNKPGAATTVGTQALVNAPADGYTWASADNATLFNNWYLFDKLPYNQNSFEYVAMTGRFPLVLIINQSVPANNFREWSQWARQNAGKTSFATAGIGSPHHIAMATLDDMLGLSLQHLPYRGDSAAVVDVIGGSVQSAFTGVATARQYLKDSRLKLLAVTWPNRLSSMPDVPTFDEVGIKNFEVYAEQGILMPAGTPKELVRQINREIGIALNLPAVREKLETLGMYPVQRSPEEFKAYALKQAITAGEIIKRKGITVN